MPNLVRLKLPHQDHYGMESYRSSGKGKEDRRVFYEGAWYYFIGTNGEVDTLEKIPFEVLKAEQDEEDAEEAERIQSKGHDCQDYVCHGMYRRDNGSLNDYYYCGECDETLQTG
jgi:hypothetical protein